MADDDLGATNDWSQFQDAPESPAAPSKQDWSQFQDAPTEPSRNHDPAQPETTSLGAGAREFARNVIPSAAGGIAGLGTAALLSEATPFVSVPAGFVAGAAVAGKTRQLQDSITDALGLDSPESRTRDVAEHPTATTAGGVASAAVTFNPTSLEANLAQRVLGGGVMAGVNAGQQLYEKGSVDPTEVAINAAGGAAMGKPWGYAEKAAKFIGGVKPPRAQIDPTLQAGLKQITDQRTAWEAGAPDEQRQLPPPGPAEPPGAPPPPGQLPPAPAQKALPPPQGEIPGASNMPGGEGLPEGAFGYEGPRPPAFTPEENGRSLGEFQPPGGEEEGAPAAPTPPEQATQTSQERSIPQTLAEKGWTKKGALWVPPEKTAPRDIPVREQVQSAAQEQVNPADVWEGKAPAENVPAREAPPEQTAKVPAREAPPEQTAKPAENVPEQEIPTAKTETPIDAKAKRDRELFDIILNSRDMAERRQAFAERQALHNDDDITQQPWNKREPVKEADAKLDEQIAKEAPKPQNLSGGATEGATDFSPAENAKAKSNLRDLWGKITRPWNTMFNPAGLTVDHQGKTYVEGESPKDFALNVRQAQGEGQQFRAQGDKAREAFDAATLKMPGKYHDEAARTFQTGEIPGNNPISGISKPLFDQERSYQEKLKKIDPEGTWMEKRLGNLFQDPVAVRDQIKAWKDEGRTTPVTVGDLLNAKLKLREELTQANGSANFPELLHALNNSRDAFIEEKAIAKRGYEDGMFSKVQRPGDVMLKNITHEGSPLFAQPDLAMMWHRYRPDAMDLAGKGYYQTAQKIKNAGTSWQLMLGLYHLFAETGEAMNGDVMRATSAAASGKGVDAIQKLMKAPSAPIRQAWTSARDALQAYYKPGEASERNRSAMEDLVRGGLTAERIKSYTPDLNTGARNYFEAWRKGALQFEAQQALERVKNNGVGQIPSEVFKAVGGAMQGMMHPLFNWYIPRLKIGAALEQMHDWNDANPGAAPRQRAEIASRILKSIDDRLGEMNQSTLFWNKTLQRGANLAFISPGWETGTVRGILGGAMSFLKNPKSIGVGSGMAFQPNAAFPLAFAITTATVGSIYEFLKTGQMPGSASEALFPQTGGKGGKEQAILPGYMKDVYQWWKALAGHETLPKSVANSLYNKLSLVPHAVWDTMANKDWADKQIVNPSAPHVKQMQQYMQYVFDNTKPIAFSQLEKGEKGSAISAGERVFGIKKAPASPQEEDQRWRDKRNNREAETARKFREKQKARYE